MIRDSATKTTEQRTKRIPFLFSADIKEILYRIPADLLDNKNKSLTGNWEYKLILFKSKVHLKLGIIKGKGERMKR